MDFETFEKWLDKLGEGDRNYLQKHPEWKKQYQAAREKRSLPKGFAEKTVEILEGGSESET